MSTLSQEHLPLEAFNGEDCMNEPANEPDITEESLEELVASGAICENCHCLHVPDIDAAILATTAASESGVAIPWCTCETCPTCRPFREAVERIMASSARLDITPHSEDSL